MNIKLNKLYSTGHIAITDIHAGGILFGYIYKERLTFLDGANVLKNYSIFDTFTQMENESESKAKESSRGSYLINNRGLIECEFEDCSMYGGFSKRDSDVLMFDVNYKNPKRRASAVYLLSESS